MPLLALKGDLVGEHPVVDDLRRDDLIGRPALPAFDKGGRRHGIVDVSVDHFQHLGRNGGGKKFGAVAGGKAGAAVPVVNG